MAEIWVHCERGAGVICDRPDTDFKGKGTAGWVNNQKTWDKLLEEWPRKGRNHLVIAKAPTENRSKLISASVMGDYSFDEALWRLEHDLKPRPRLDVSKLHRSSPFGRTSF